MLASLPHCDPAIVTRTLAMLDRMAAEDMAWNRTPPCMRRWREGFAAVVIARRGITEAVKLGDLTSRELDALLSVPAGEMACSAGGL